MNEILVFELTILVLAIFLGFEVISKVPTMLHTPLMSGTNAIHGIVIVGAMLVARQGGRRHADAGPRLRRRRARHRRTWSAASSSPTGCSRCSRSASPRSQPMSTDRRLTSPTWSRSWPSSWRCGSSPRRQRARRGNQIGAAGMVLAIAVTLAQEGLDDYCLDRGSAMAIGGVFGVVGARAREDDGDAADGGAVQRRRRRRGGADRARGVPQPRARRRATCRATSRSRSCSRR